MTCVCVDCIEYPCECLPDVQAAKVRWTVEITALRAELRKVQKSRHDADAEASIARKDAHLVNKQMRDLRAELDRKQRVEHPVCLCGDTITPDTINADNCLLTPDGWICGVCRP